jgi:pyruvate formate lyase activating enzyme
LSRFDNLTEVEVLPYHVLGRPKYENLGLDYPMGDAPQLTERDAAHAKAIIERARKE